ncbi:MAG: hypothetical protein AB7F86_06035 [Bdellovibrionales bacterium]
MPNCLRNYFFRHSLRWHFLVAFAVGLVLRGLCAYFVFGPQALDDYKHGVWPAYQFFANLPLDIPNYRSHLLVWTLSSFIWLGSLVGVDSALGQVRSMYFGLGAISMTALLGTYLYVRATGSRLFGAAALYLMAMFPIMPFISTRAFGESVAMSLVVMGFGTLGSARRRTKADFGIWMAGFLWLGLATLFRFHVGLLYVTYMVTLVIRREWRGLIAGSLAGLIILFTQCAVDLLSGKAALETLRVYLLENEGGGAKYGVSPWYNPVLFILGISLAPFSFVLWPGCRSLWRKHWPIISCALMFLIAHCLVAHKEERFLYPILGLQLWWVAYLWAFGARQKWARRVFSPVLLLITGLVLPVACLVNTQEGEIGPPARLESKYHNLVYLDYQSLFGRSRFQFYFLRPPSVMEKIEPEEFSVHRVEKSFHDYPSAEAVAFLTSEPEARDRLRLLAGLTSISGQCLQLEESGSLVDKLIYSLNPKHNQRRRPTWQLVCERRLEDN